MYAPFILRVLIQVDDKYGKEALSDDSMFFSKEVALRVFNDFFRYGDAMDPDAPLASHGIFTIVFRECK